MIDSEKTQKNFISLMNLHKKAIDVLKKANGEKSYMGIAKELNMPASTVSTILRQAYQYEFAKKQGNFYKKVPGILGYIPKLGKSSFLPKFSEKSFKRKIVKIKNPIESAAWKNAESYPFIYILENSLRKLIMNKFDKENNWWQNKVSTDVQEYAERIKQAEKKCAWLPARGNHPIFYVGLNELFKIIDKNHHLYFKEVFPDKGHLRTWFGECVPIRNLLAHNIPLKKDEKDNLRIKTKYIVTLINKSE